MDNAPTEASRPEPRPEPCRRHRVPTIARRHPYLVGFLLLIAATAGLRLWWGGHVGRQLADQRAAIRARGEPLTLADVQVTPVPDEQNAWTLIAQAGALDNQSSPANSQLSFPWYPPFGSAWDGLAKGSELSNAAVFQLVRQARSRPRAQLVRSYGPPLQFPGGGNYNRVRTVANTVGDGAVYKHLTGDDAEAVERLRDVLHLGNALYQDDLIVSQLVGVGLTALAVYDGQVIAPGLRAAEPETREAVRRLIADLLDERLTTDGLRRSFVLDRLAADDTHGWRANGAWVLRPLAEGAIMRANADALVYAAAAREPNAPAARRVLKNLQSEEAPPVRWAPMFGGARPDLEIPRYSRWYPSTGRNHLAFEQWFRCLAERRVTAVSLAAQLYRADHGTWPGRLDELVPTYLPAVPVDPFRADGGPAGYTVLKGALPDGSDRPLVYYDAGETENVALDPEPMYGWQIERRPDGFRSRREVRQHRDLARWLPPKRRFEEDQRQQQEFEQRMKQLREPREASPPEAVEDDPDQPSAPRGDAEKRDGADE